MSEHATDPGQPTNPVSRGRTDTDTVAAADDAPTAGNEATAAPAKTEVSDRRSDQQAHRAARREMAVAMLAAAAGGALVLSVTGRTWAHGRAVLHGTPLAVSATGNTVNRAPAALALLALAGALAVWATRRTWRQVVGAVLLLGGAGIAAASVTAASDTSALDEKAAAKAALAGAHATHVSHTAWPWLAALGGLLVVVAGLLVTVRGRRWPGMSSRYDAPGRRDGTRPKTSADLWNALDRGEDPTDPSRE